MKANERSTAAARGFGLSRRELADMNGFRALLQSLKLFGCGRRSVFWSLFFFTVPFVIVTDVYAIFKLLSLTYPPQQQPTLSQSITDLRSIFSMADSDKQLEEDMWVVAVGAMVVSFVSMFIFMWVYFVVALFLFMCVYFIVAMFPNLFMVASVNAAVGSIHSGRKTTLFEFANLESGWVWRLLATNLVYLSLVFLAVTGTFALDFIISFLPVPESFANSIFWIMVTVLLIRIHLILPIARAVACFEDQQYGLAAFKRGNHLLRNKTWSALSLLTVTASPVFLAMLLEYVSFTYKLDWTLYSIYVIFAAYLTELEFICWAVFYFSCSAFSEKEVASEKDQPLQGSNHFMPMDNP